MTPQGAIAAMVGGVDYDKSVFNRVTQAHRQPGSSFKPFVYTAALERGLTPWDWREDQPVNISGYQPINYHNASYGRLRLIDALARSVNTISVNLAQEAGIETVASTAHRLGITSTLHPYASLALGTDVVTPLELTAAYAAFMAGERVKPYLVQRIDKEFDGGTAWQREAPAPSPVLADAVRRDMTAMLYQVVQGGTGTAARLGDREAAGKTGTSQEYRDAWFVGFTADHVAGVWVGNDDNAPMRGVTGGLVPARLWRQVMLAADAGLPARPLDRTEAAPASLAAEPGFEDLPSAPSDEIASQLGGQPVRYTDLRVDSPPQYAETRSPAPYVPMRPNSRDESMPSLAYAEPPAGSRIVPNGPPGFERAPPAPSQEPMSYQQYYQQYQQYPRGYAVPPQSYQYEDARPYPSR
jgi:penicillin-binding protein 1A